MEKTRVEYKTRLELLERRANYLSNELSQIEKEISLLEELRDFYNTHSEDSIDEARAQMCYPAAAVFRPKSNQELIIEALLSGPKSYTELLQITKLKNARLSDVLFRLRKKGKIVSANNVHTLVVGSEVNESI